MNMQRAQHTATALADGRVLVVGGALHHDGRRFDDVIEVFDGKTWSTLGSPSTVRHRASAALLADGRLILVGGDDPNASNFMQQALKSVEVIDPKTGKTVAGPALRRERVEAELVVLADGRLFIVGDAFGPGATAEVWQP
jgi:hypothetical protein